MIEVNGNYGEGGGQIVRTALALSTLMQKPFRAYDIRKERKEPGLKNQHLYCIDALRKICDAKTDAAELGSEKIIYAPSAIKQSNIEVDIGTAVSITLFLQSVMFPLMFAGKRSKITVRGGTDTKWSPSFDYLNYVMMPHLRKFADIELSILKRGFYPKGGGIVELKMKPFMDISGYENFGEFVSEARKKFKPIIIEEQGNLLAIKGVSHASEELREAKVAERQSSYSSSILTKNFNINPYIRVEYSKTYSIGSVMTLWAAFAKKDETGMDNPIIIGADSLGEKGKKAEDVGKDAASSLIKEVDSRCAVDKYLGDMLLPYMAVVGGKIKVSGITNHTLSNIYAIELFFGKMFEIDEKENKISCRVS